MQLKYLDLEAPEEYLDLWVAELRRILSLPVTSSQEPNQYPLIRVVIRSEEEDKRFVKFLQAKLGTGELTPEFKIIPIRSE
jgi:hypothetical protein